jgi:hypothetical protein
MISAVVLPVPNTICRRPSACSLQRVHSPMSSRICDSGSAADRTNAIGTAAISSCGAAATAGASATADAISSTIGSGLSRRRHAASRLMPVTPSSW